MFRMRLVKSFLILVVLTLVECKKILGIYGYPGKSHQILAEVILKKLAERGHQITMVSTFFQEKPFPNYKDVFLDGFIEDINKNEIMYLEMKKHSFQNFLGGFKLMHDFTNKTLHRPTMQRLMKSGEKYDLIIIDWFCKDSELFYGNISICSFDAQIGANYLAPISIVTKYKQYNTKM